MTTNFGNGGTFEIKAGNAYCFFGKPKRKAVVRSSRKVHKRMLPIQKWVCYVLKKI